MTIGQQYPVSSATFISASPGLNYCPPPDMPEYAFIGRSNVGKSSLINMLLQRKNLARTSGTPGKTRLINHFLVNEKWYIADLPGYGYAKVSKKERAIWQNMIQKYLLERTNLLNTFILVDIRISPQTNDLEMLRWLGKAELPFAIAFTKTDKLKRQQLAKAIQNYASLLEQEWEELPLSFVTSSNTAAGRDEIFEFIEEQNRGFAS